MKLKYQFLNSLAGLCISLGMTAQANALTIYANDFSTGTASGFSVVGAQGGANGSGVITAPNSEQFIGILTQGANATLNLTGLAAHTSVTLSFDVYAFRSLDGFNCCGPDYFRVQSGSTVLVNDLYDLVSGSGGPVSLQTSSDPSGFGYGSFFTGETTFHYDITFADSASSLSLAFFANSDQAWADEGWGLDNVVVSTNGVPEPGSLALFGLALAGFGAARRKAKR